MTPLFDLHDRPLKLLLSLETFDIENVCMKGRPFFRLASACSRVDGASAGKYLSCLVKNKDAPHEEASCFTLAYSLLFDYLLLVVGQRATSVVVIFLAYAIGDHWR